MPRGKRSLDFSTPTNLKKQKVLDSSSDYDQTNLNSSLNTSLARPLDISAVEESEISVDQDVIASGMV